MPKKHPEIFRCTKRHTESSGAHQKANQRLSGHRKPKGWHLDARKAKPRGLEGTERHAEAAGLTEWQMGSAGGTKRPKEGFGAN